MDQSDHSTPGVYILSQVGGYQLLLLRITPYPCWNVIGYWCLPPQWLSFLRSVGVGVVLITLSVSGVLVMSSLVLQLVAVYSCEAPPNAPYLSPQTKYTYTTHIQYNLVGQWEFYNKSISHASIICKEVNLMVLWKPCIQFQVATETLTYKSSKYN